MEWGQFANNPAILARVPPPEVPFYAQYYLTAFNMLTTDRLNSGSGIPMPSKKAFIDLYHVDDPIAFLNIIDAMDKAYLAAVVRVQEMRAKNNQ